MDAVAGALDALDWPAIAAALDAEGHALLPDLLQAPQARALRQLATGLRRVPLAGMEGGPGEQLYFDPHPPAPLQAWRTGFYRHLAPIANRWNATLQVDERYPDDLDAFARRNRQAGQMHAQSHLSRLGPHGHLALHQRTEGTHVFPLQVVALLSEPGAEFEGGEFVMTEQRPRMQSRPIVLPLRQGDVAVICTAQRPVRGSRGWYRVNLRHAISRVHRGERLGLELSFHDAP